MNYQQHFGLLVFTYHEGIPARSFKVLSIKLWKIHRFNMAEGSVGAPVYRSSILLPSTMNLSEYEQRIFKNKNKQPTKAKTVEDVIYLFGKHQGVVGVMAMDKAGLIITSNFAEAALTGMYVGISKQILDTMTPILDAATSHPPKIHIIRINSCSQEVIIAPVVGEDLIFIVVQDPEDRPSITVCTKSDKSVAAKAQESSLLRAREEVVVEDDEVGEEETEIPGEEIIGSLEPKAESPDSSLQNENNTDGEKPESSKPDMKTGSRKSEGKTSGKPEGKGGKGKSAKKPGSLSKGKTSSGKPENKSE